MPVAVLTRIERPEELVDFLADYLKDNLTEFQFVSKYDEQLLPNYPCIQIQPGDLSRDYHSTRTFEITMRAFIYVMHDKLTQTKRVRTQEELRMVSSVVDFLHSDLTLGGRIINGFVNEETPAILPPRGPRGDVIVSTRIDWACLQHVLFK